MTSLLTMLEQILRRRRRGEEIHFRRQTVHEACRGKILRSVQQDFTRNFWCLQKVEKIEKSKTARSQTAQVKRKLEDELLVAKQEQMDALALLR